MALKLGAYTACLHDRPLGEALDVLEADGLTSVEVNTGGFIPSPHCHVDLLLSSEQARRDYLETFSSRGMELTGLNCNGNPLNPLPGVGIGNQEAFTYQCRAFLDQVAGTPDPLPANASFADALHTMEIIQAVVRSSRSGGAPVDVASASSPTPLGAEAPANPAAPA